MRGVGGYEQECGTKKNNCLSPQIMRPIAGVGGQSREWSGLVRMVKKMGVRHSGNST